jgi:hypothetical protein
VETTGGAWGGRPPEDDGTHTLEAHRTDALQGVTKEEGTLRGRRRRRGGKRHEKLAKAFVNGTARFDCEGVESFTLCFGLSGPAPLLPQSSLLRGGTCPDGGSHADVFPAGVTSDNVSELVPTANTVVDHQVRALIREEHVARDFRGTGCPRHPGECQALAHDRVMPQPSPQARAQPAMKGMIPKNIDYSDTLVLLRPIHIRRRRGASGTTAKLTP